MFNKLYVQMKLFLKENAKFLIGLVLLFMIVNYPLPYYINTPGGLIDVSKRVEIAGGTSPSGSLNMAYVSEINATIPTMIIAFFNKNWDVYKEEDMLYDNESMDDVHFRDKLLLKEATSNAIEVGFRKAGKMFERISEKVFITYISTEADTDLEVGDEIITIDSVNINNKNILDNVIQSKSAGDTLILEVRNNDVSYERYAVLREESNRLVIGILITEDIEYKTDPEIKLTFKKSESGPSGGLMTALAIYNYLIDDDITHGKTIVGTGTIDLEGNVGSIGGVKYKIKGAMKYDADIFLVPVGENYEEALRVKAENDYNIDIIPISTFDEAIEFLSNLK